jgi:hypothetical protein
MKYLLPYSYILILSNILVTKQYAYTIYHLYSGPIWGRGGRVSIIADVRHKQVKACSRKHAIGYMANTRSEQWLHKGSLFILNSFFNYKTFLMPQHLK